MRRETIALHSGTTLPEGEPVRHEVAGASVILVRVHDTIRAYANRCPHRGTELDWTPGRLLDPSGNYLQCSTHGALFRIDTGECVAGPCRGEALESLPFTFCDQDPDTTVAQEPPPGASGPEPYFEGKIR